MLNDELYRSFIYSQLACALLKSLLPMIWPCLWVRQCLTRSMNLLWKGCVKFIKILEMISFVFGSSIEHVAVSRFHSFRHVFGDLSSSTLGCGRPSFWDIVFRSPKNGA